MEPNSKKMNSGYRKSSTMYCDSPFIKKAVDGEKARVVKPSEVVNKENSPEGSEKEKE